MRRVRFFVALLIYLTVFLIFSNISRAIEVMPQDIDKHLSLSKESTQIIIQGLLEKLTLRWIDLIASGYSDPQEQIIVVIVKKAVRTKIIDYAFSELPKDMAKKELKAIYKIARFVYTDKKIVFLLKEIEKMSVNKAKRAAEEWLFQNEIKVGVGNLPVSYTSYKGEKIEIQFPYIVTYKASSQEEGIVGVAIYSSEQLEPPESAGSNLSRATSDFWYQEEWEEGATVPPFIVHFKGTVEKTQFGTYRWVGNPDMSIEFPKEVPKFEFREPTLTDKIKNNLKERMLVLEKIDKMTGGKRQKETSRKSSDLSDQIKKIVDSLFEKIKSVFSSTYFLSGTVMPTNLVQPETIRTKTDLQNNLIQEEETKEVVSPKKEETQPLDSLPTSSPLNETSPIAGAADENKTDEVDVVLNQKEEQVKEQDLLPQEVEEEEKEKQKEEKEEENKLNVCSKENATTVKQKRVIINEIAWMGMISSSSDEWFELRNLTNNRIDLSGWQVVNQENKINIVFPENSYLEPNSYFLLERTDDNSAPLKKADIVYTGALKNSKESLFLFNAQCQIEDYVSADPDWPAGDNSAKKTMERENDLSWHTSFVVGGTPRSENTTPQKPAVSIASSASSSHSGGGSSETTSSYCSRENLDEPTHSPVIINEIAWMGTTNSVNDEWIEIKNVSDSVVSLDNWQLLDKNLDIKKILNPSDVIEPGNFLILERTDDDTLPIVADVIYKGALNNNEESLYLFDENCNLIDTVSADPDWPAGDNSAKKTMERASDLTWYTSEAVGGTPKQENDQPSSSEEQSQNSEDQSQEQEQEQISYCSQEGLGEPAYSPVIINEIAWMGTTNSANDEWIEFKNISDANVSLANWQLLDKDLGIKIIFNDSDSIESGAFFLLERTDDESVPNVLADKIYIGSLNNQKESLRLFNNKCELIDEVVADPDWPAGDNTEKKTMERGTDLAWHTYTGEGEDGILGTPRAENSKKEEQKEEKSSQGESFVWSQFTNNAGRTGMVSVNAPGSSDNSQVVVDQMFKDLLIGDQGTLFIASNDGVYSYSSSFEQNWFFEKRDVVALAGGQNKTIFVISDKLIALDQSGNELWTYDLSVAYEELKPAILDDRIYVLNKCMGETGFALFKFDLEGNLGWVFDTAVDDLAQKSELSCQQGGYSSGQYLSSPAVASDGSVYFGTQKDLYALDSDGKLKWKRSFDVKYKISSPSVGSDGTVYLVADQLLALNPQNGETLWEFRSATQRSNFGPAIDSSGNLYVWAWRQGGVNFFALNGQDQSVLWNIEAVDLGRPSKLSEILVTNNLIVFTANRTLMAYDYQGQRVWTFTLPPGSTIWRLAISPDGKLFVTGQKLVLVSP